MEDHDCAAVDEKTGLAGKHFECARLEVIEEIEEHRAVELDFVMGLHRVRRRRRSSAFI